MHVEIVLAALVMVVAVLVAADFFRRTSDAPHEYPAGNEPGPALDAGTETYPASRAASVGVIPRPATSCRACSSSRRVLVRRGGT